QRSILSRPALRLKQGRGLYVSVEERHSKAEVRGTGVLSRGIEAGREDKGIGSSGGVLKPGCVVEVTAEGLERVPVELEEFSLDADKLKLTTKMRKAAQDLLAILKAEASGGLFLDYSGQSKTSDPFPEVKKRTGPKTVRVPFFFLASSSEKTPKPSEELILLQAGLGRRSARVPEDADHKEITNILCEVYPKMAELEGAWLIHKATGKKQKIQFEGGYSGASLVQAWGGKGCLYIMPIQHTLDTSPLALTAPEFESMPKARCMTCYKDVPLQLLTMHVQSCRPEQISGPELDAPFEVACPVCGELFSQAVINIHAEFSSLTRKSQSQAPLTGPDRTRAEMVRAIESRCFEGDERENPKYNVSAYQDNTFRYCGEIFAASVVQGGPAPHVLTHHTYHYLCHGQLDKDVVKAGTASVDMENLVTEVQDAEEDSLMALTAQLRDGLALYGLDELLVEQPLLCQQLFVPGFREWMPIS
ncbi:hypothetical protein JOQ06_023144, partial [Pogonophryne albipinna]